jgi:hypothetical protein
MLSTQLFTYDKHYHAIDDCLMFAFDCFICQACAFETIYEHISVEF